MSYCIGLDLSLTGAGIGVIRAPMTGDETGARRLHAWRVVGESGRKSDSAARTAIRIGEQHRRILEAIRWTPVTLAVLEALPRHMDPNMTQMFLERSALHWRVLESLARLGIPFAEVSTTTLKLFTCGSGKATKPEMVVAVRDLFPGCGITNHNAADGAALAEAGAQHLGWHNPTALHHFNPKINWPKEIAHA